MPSNSTSQSFPITAVVESKTLTILEQIKYLIENRKAPESETNNMMNNSTSSQYKAMKTDCNKGVYSL